MKRERQLRRPRTLFSLRQRRVIKTHNPQISGVVVRGQPREETDHLAACVALVARRAWRGGMSDPDLVRAAACQVRGCSQAVLDGDGREFELFVCGGEAEAGEVGAWRGKRDSETCEEAEGEKRQLHC